MNVNIYSIYKEIQPPHASYTKSRSILITTFLIKRRGRQASGTQKLCTLPGAVRYSPSTSERPTLSVHPLYKSFPDNTTTKKKKYGGLSNGSSTAVANGTVASVTPKIGGPRRARCRQNTTGPARTNKQRCGTDPTEVDSVYVPTVQAGYRSRHDGPGN